VRTVSKLNPREADELGRDEILDNLQPSLRVSFVSWFQVQIPKLEFLETTARL
jgi:hypothetical protein